MEPTGAVAEQEHVAAGGEGQPDEHQPVRAGAALGGGPPEVRGQQRHQQRLGECLGHAAIGGVGQQVRRRHDEEGDEDGATAGHRRLRGGGASSLAATAGRGQSW